MAQSINSGTQSEIINLAITDSGWTVLPALIKKPNNLLIRLREAGDILVSLDDSGTTYLTIPEGLSLTYDWNTGRTDNFIWLKGSVSGTAEIVVTYE